ncbi:hypothetical protein [Calidifontibacillus oryziterrae]|uniref:hypothetical protein n=1 Tax=Calidifontibacillus oryziterrae TaxID=1191699 RepID=UPI000316640D|nr:hypothetical protein [Calidifontibacillus oryziterrae]
MINELSLSGLLFLISIVFTAVGFILGSVFMVKQLAEGIIMIMIAVSSGILFFGIGKVLQLLNDIKGQAIVPSPDNQLIENNQSKEIVEEPAKIEKAEEEKEVEVPYNVPVDWKLTAKQRSNIMAYYLKDKQRIVEKNIIVTPFKGYCVVKTNHFIDVIEMVDDHPITLKRDQVDNFKELRQWIEANVFRKK